MFYSNERTHLRVGVAVVVSGVLKRTANRRTEDGVRWKEALEALSTATGQLNSLKTAAGTFTESTITLDPKEFFSTVCVRERNVLHVAHPAGRPITFKPAWRCMLACVYCHPPLPDFMAARCWREAISSLSAVASDSGRWQCA